MSNVSVSVNLGAAPIRSCYISYCQNLDLLPVIPTLSVAFDGVHIYFETPAQIAQLVAVLEEGRTKLEDLICANQNGAPQPVVAAMEEMEGDL